MTNTPKTPKTRSPAKETQDSPTKTDTTTDTETETSAETSAEKRPPARRAADRRPRPVEVLREARAQLTELTGMEAESVSSFEQTEDGWVLEIEVLELVRVPDTMSLLASYQVELDPEGMLTGYRRVRRYERGRSDSHRPGGR